MAATAQDAGEFQPVKCQLWRFQKCGHLLFRYLQHFRLEPGVVFGQLGKEALYAVLPCLMLGDASVLVRLQIGVGADLVDQAAEIGQKVHCLLQVVCGKGQGSLAFQERIRQWADGVEILLPCICVLVEWGQIPSGEGVFCHGHFRR